MTDTPGWAPPSSSEPPREDARPPADAPAVPGQSSPHHTTPPAWGGGYGGPPPGGPQPWGGQPWVVAPVSPKPGIIPLRPLGVGEILDGAVSTVRRHWRAALGISLALSVVKQVLGTAVQWWSYENPNGNLPDLAAIATAPVDLLIGVIASAMLTMLVSRAVLGRPAALGEVWRDSRPRLLQLLGLTLLTALALLAIMLVAAAPLVGYLLVGDGDLGTEVLLGVVAVLGVPVVVWVGIRLSLAAPALMLEKQGVLAAVSRSLRLVKGSWWRIFGINALSTLLISIVAGIFVTPFTLAAMVVGGDHASTGFGGLGPQLPPAALVIMAVGGLIAGTVTIPVSATVSVLLYVDQRIRREALDIELARAAGLPEYGGAGWGGSPDPAAPRL